jgi:short subunit dehydrogenase-like uncharacterized protein
MSTEEREFDVVVWGATGFTGQLVAEYLLRRYGAGGTLRWSLGGRNESKLEAVRAELAKQTADAATLPLVVGDSDDESFLEALAARTRVVCTTVGPYVLYGSKLVAACARGGTHYCDLTGELQWMRRMIDSHHGEAQASGARIIHAAGFDSVPSDLGVWFVQREMKARTGQPSRRVKMRAKGFSGGASGGTIASMLAMMEEQGENPEVRRIFADPYALNPEGERSGPDSNEAMAPAYDEDFGAWTGPFVMAPCDTRIVRRTNALLGYAYGKDFRYEEAMLTGAGPGGFAKAAALSAGLVGGMGAMAVGPLRRLIAKRLPAPGEGPTREQQEQGYYDLRFYAEHPQDEGKGLHAQVTGDRDPGYGSTSKILGEVAVCLAKDDVNVAGGFWTPASAFGEHIFERLESNAGLAFAILD